jgi:hypothetical protein
LPERNEIGSSVPENHVKIFFDIELIFFDLILNAVVCPKTLRADILGSVLKHADRGIDADLLLK